MCTIAKINAPAGARQARATHDVVAKLDRLFF
jgi:hypothetical protein